ncbi:MAG TPA: isocitrate lyase/phosphoenolpyruvate mutase family protein [Nocardioides sp.]|uniref:isocitrate lyase/PEP mutase family protein n=1 Tax=Nocardioides sp. TaxID=35761 RepID=UPI002E337FBF|nr:isocitrate lyase/phosphoenolpyruvate mutase family protein [Nocardioides sp.]HEX3931813.1 isocitrate lyase/phosphoenolpyruvate mutase family protein [Nocardioides sp.]
MTAAGARLKDIISRPDAVIAAPVFDPLSTHLSARRGFEVAKLSGTVWKGAELAQPDDLPLAYMSDLVDISRRILRVADICLMVDADDGGPSAVSVYRTVRELEQVGVAAIELEDNLVPRFYGEVEDRHGLVISQKEFVGKLQAAVDARRDDSTLIVARLVLRTYPDRDEALARIVAYAEAGVDAIMLPGLGAPRDGRDDLQAIHAVTDLPLFALGLPWDVQTDAEFMRANNVKVRYVSDFPLYRMAIKNMDDCLAYMAEGGDPADLDDRMGPLSLVRHAPESVSQIEFFKNWSQKYVQLEDE